MCQNYLILATAGHGGVTLKYEEAKFAGKLSVIGHRPENYNLLQMKDGLNPCSNYIERIIKECAAGLKSANDEFQREINKLKQAETLFQTLSSSSPVGVYIVQDGKFQFVNPQFQEFTGYREEELLGRNTSMVVLPEDRGLARKNAVDMLKGRHTCPYEFRSLTKSGQTKWILEQVASIQFLGKRAVLGNCMDITSRKQAEDKIRTAHQRLQDIIEFLPDATFVLDQDRKVIAWNRAIEEMTGVQKEHILGRGNYAYSAAFYGKPRQILVDLIFEDGQDSQRLYKFYEKRGTTIVGESYLPSLRGKEVILWGTASPLFESIRDITDRKRAEKMLLESEKRYRNLVENINDIIFSLDTCYRITYISNVFEKKLLFSIEEVMGQPLSSFVHPEDMPGLLNSLESAKNGQLERSEFRLIGKDGSVYHFRASSRPLLENEQLTGLTGVMVDITRSKQFEREMYRMDQMNLIGEMAAGIAHEIRNPMTTVKGFLQLFKTREKYAQEREYFELMVSELDRANSIITEFLSLAKNKAVKLRPQNLNEIVRAMHPLITADANVADKFTAIELGDIPEILLDEREIRQLILNLVRNGLEAMSPGGRLTIKTYLNNGDVVLLIQDQGSGIEPDVLAKLGTPFMSTKDNGTGLGLAVCYSIAARHNAKIDVKTGPGGTTFFVSFSVQAPASQVL